MQTNELTHHGIKGMRWGVRRFQNKDGTLTPAGKKRIAGMSDDKAVKTLSKSIKNKRAQLHGGSNKWMSTMDIGDNSKLAYDRYWKRRDSKEARDAYEELSKINEKYDKYINGRVKTFDFEAAKNAAYKADTYTGTRNSSRGTKRGEGYTKAFIDGTGKDLTISKLNDLGYSTAEAKELTERFIKSNRSLAFE